MKSLLCQIRGVRHGNSIWKVDGMGMNMSSNESGNRYTGIKTHSRTPLIQMMMSTKTSVVFWPVTHCTGDLRPFTWSLCSSVRLTYLLRVRHL